MFFDPLVVHSQYEPSHTSATVNYKNNTLQQLQSSPNFLGLLYESSNTPGHLESFHSKTQIIMRTFTQMKGRKREGL